MNKKGMNLITKSVLIVGLLFLILGGINYLSIGILRSGLIGMVTSSTIILTIIYVIMGLSEIVLSGILFFKILRE